MTIIARILRGPLFVWLLIFVSFTAPVSAHNIDHQSNYVLPDSPISAGVLVAQAIHNGTIRLNRTSHGSVSSPALTCSPAPCALPNVQASEGGQPVNEDPIVTNPTNKQILLTGGDDYNCFTTYQGFYVSTNGGTTWNHTCMNPLSGTSGGGEPGVGFDAKGVAYITGLDFVPSGGSEIVFEKSTNDGKTWSVPAVAVKSLFPGGSTDSDWLQVDNNASSPRVNTLYISVTQSDASHNREISVSHSTNGGKTWSTVVVDTKQLYPAIDQFSDMITDKAGNVYVTWMRCTANGSASDCGGTTASFMMSKSTDGGNTWSTPVTINTTTLAPDNCGGGFYGCLPNTHEPLSNIPAIGVDDSTGKHAGYLYVVNYNYTGTYTSVQVTVSTDGGTTWGTPVAAAPSSDTHDQFFPWLSVSSTGIIGVTWLDRRNDPSNLSYEEFAATANSVNNLANSNVQLATQPSNPNNDGLGGQFMGNYTGSAWAGLKLYASWMDSRNGVNDQDEVGGLVCKIPPSDKLSGC